MHALVPDIWPQKRFVDKFFPLRPPRAEGVARSSLPTHGGTNAMALVEVFKPVR